MRWGSVAELNGEPCPVPLDLLAAVYRATDIAAVVADIPERTRARLAMYLYGRSHTYDIGLQVAGTCSADELHAVAGRLGREIHTLATKHRPLTPIERRPSTKSRISLSGIRA